MKKFFIFLFVLIAKTSLAQWLHVNPGTTNWIADVSFPTEQIGYASDDHSGKIWKTTDGAATWNLLNNNLYVTKMVFLSQDTGFALSDSGLAKTIDGGLNWSSVLFAQNITWWTRPIFFDHQNGITVQSNSSGDSAYVYKTNDGGITWLLVSGNSLFTGAYVADISFPDSLTGYISGETDLYKTVDGGLTWTLLQSRYPGFGSCSFVSPDTGFLYVDFGDFFRTYDGGLTWDSFPLPTTPLNGQVRFLNPSQGFLCGGDGLTSGFILKTNNAGTNWTMDFSDNYTYLSFSYPTPDVGYACGSGGSVIKNSMLNLTLELNNDDVSIIPNPFQSKLSIHLNEFTNTFLYIYNSLGELIFRKVCANQDEVIDLDHLQNGLYFLSIENCKGNFSQKIIKQD